MDLNLRPEIEQRLRALADANGISPEDYLQRVVEEKIGGGSPQRRLSAEDWAHQFEEWANSFPEAPLIPDEALRRENLYPDRW